MSFVNGDALRGVLVALVFATAVCGVAMVLALLAVPSPPGAITVIVCIALMSWRDPCRTVQGLTSHRSATAPRADRTELAVKGMVVFPCGG